ncbi:hypothetical protein ANTPLA_LOCUS9083 [Anthophora plagiata]
MYTYRDTEFLFEKEIVSRCSVVSSLIQSQRGRDRDDDEGVIHRRDVEEEELRVRAKSIIEVNARRECDVLFVAMCIINCYTQLRRLQVMAEAGYSTGLA